MDIKIISINVQGLNETVLHLYEPDAVYPLENQTIILDFIQRAIENKSPYGKVPLDKSSYAFAIELVGNESGCPSCLIIDFELNDETYSISVPFDREDNNAYCRKKR
jgi:hypothetical protein